MKIILGILISVGALSFGRAFSQTYISNGDFEQISKCPKFWSEKPSDFKLNDWYSPSKATPDYYSACSKQCNTHTNWMSSTPIKGNGGYAGLITYKPKESGKEYREYLQTKLTQKLRGGQIYAIRMNVFWPLESGYSVNNIHILMSSISINSNKEGRISATKYLKTIGDKYSARKGEWVELEFEFIASGKEKYLTIGNFEGNPEQKVEGKYGFSYLFLDDVVLTHKTYSYQLQGSTSVPDVISRVELLDEEEEVTHELHNCSCWSCQIRDGLVDKEAVSLESITDFELHKGERIDLNKVVFDYQSGKMSTASKNELNKLYFILDEQPNAKLRFVISTYEYTQNGNEIAKETALEIYNYLRRKGIKNSFTYLHATTDNLQQLDGVNRDRKIEMLVVSNK